MLRTLSTATEETFVLLRQSYITSLFKLSQLKTGAVMILITHAIPWHAPHRLRRQLPAGLQDAQCALHIRRRLQHLPVPELLLVIIVFTCVHRRRVAANGRAACRRAVLRGDDRAHCQHTCLMPVCNPPLRHQAAANSCRQQASRGVGWAARAPAASRLHTAAACIQGAQSDGTRKLPQTPPSDSSCIILEAL